MRKLGQVSWIYGLQVDLQGNTYITGSTVAKDFPITQGVFQARNKTNSSTGFVAMLNGNGSGLVYSTFLGGSLEDVPSAITIDSEGNSYIVGSTRSTDFPTTTGAFSTSNRASVRTGFVTKMNPSGTSLIYSTYLGGDYSDTITAIALDSANEPYSLLACVIASNMRWNRTRSSQRSRIHSISTSSSFP
jgi:hypothetical protein